MSSCGPPPTTPNPPSIPKITARSSPSWKSPHYRPTKSKIKKRKSKIFAADEILENSAAGRTGKFIAPVFYPLGYDWKTSIGVMGAFFAREVVVSTMGIAYSAGNTDDSTDTLQNKMLADTQTTGPARANPSGPP